MSACRFESQRISNRSLWRVTNSFGNAQPSPPSIRCSPRTTCSLKTHLCIHATPSVRVMPMHVSRSPALAKDIGRGTKPCHVSNDCLAAAGKTRFRAPFGGLSRTTPVPLRHRGPGLGMCRDPGESRQSFRLRCLLTIHRWHGVAGPSPPAWLRASNASQARRSLLQLRGEPFSARAPAWSFASSLHTGNTGPASTHRHAL
jgi:hypothetical protein